MLARTQPELIRGRGSYFGVNSGMAMQDGLFRFGFLCHRDDSPPPGDNTWRSVSERWIRWSIGRFILYVHPEVPIRLVEKDGHFIVLLGHVFSSDGTQPERHLLNLDLSESGLSGTEGLDSLSGRFAILVIREDRCVALNDAFGARSIFFRTSEPFGISSHATLLAHAFRTSRRPDIAALMRTGDYLDRKVKYLPGNATVYENTLALLPNTCLDSATGLLARYWPTQPKKPADMDEFLYEFDRYLVALERFITEAHLAPLFGITGGIDSRAVFASFVRAGHPFIGMTWLGGYLRPEERPTVDSIVRRFEIPHQYLKPNNKPSDDVTWVSEQNAGRMRDASRLSTGMHSAYGAQRRLAFIRGYGGEIIRGFYNLRSSRMMNLGVPEMARMYFVGQRHEVREEFKQITLRQFEDFHKWGRYDLVEGFGYDPADLFYWEHRMGMWGSTMLNELDAGVYSLVGLNSRKLYRLAFGLPDEQRLSKELLRTVVARQDEWLASLPCT
jgi:hypothetical protein